MNYTDNYNLNKPELAEQFNLDDWNDNSDTIDSALAGLQNLTDQTFKTALLNFCYPVGSLYWSSSSTNPAQLFGGTWTQIKDKFIWAKGDSDTVNATGGAKTVTLTTNNMPSHSHTINNGNTSSSGTLTTAGFRGVSATSTSMSANSSGWFQIRSSAVGATIPFAGGNVSTVTTGDNDIDSMATSSYGSGKQNKHTINVAHTHNVTANGYLYGSTDASGSGTAVNKMPPYVVKYCWERTA